MNNLRNMSFEVLCGERQITLANLNRNEDYLSAEIEKRWSEIRNKK